MNYLLEAITPTRIYIKQCSHCDKHYLGKTTKNNIEAYKGSGVRWTRHLKKHQAQSIHIWQSEWFYDKSIVDYALGLSEEHNIVKSVDWFNAKPEDGLMGGNPGPEGIAKMKSTRNDPVWKKTVGADSVEKTKQTKLERGNLGKNNTDKMVATRKQNGSFNVNADPEVIKKTKETKSKNKATNPNWGKQSAEARAGRTGLKRGSYNVSGKPRNNTWATCEVCAFTSTKNIITRFHNDKCKKRAEN